MATEELQRFAAGLGRPPGSLSAFARLAPQQLDMLSAAIERACARQRVELEQSFRKAVPWPLRGLVLRLLRGNSDAGNPPRPSPPPRREGDQA